MTRAGESLRDRVRQVIKEDADRHRGGKGDDILCVRKHKSVQHAFVEEVLPSVCRKLGPLASFLDYSKEFGDRWNALSEVEKTVTAALCLLLSFIADQYLGAPEEI
jgi:hypothetical protein